MAGGREARHVDADLGDDDVGDDLTDARHRLQPGRGLGDRRHAFSHGGIHLLQSLLEGGDDAQVQLQQGAMMRRHMAAQGLDQFRALVPGGAPRQVGEPFRILLSGDDRGEHGPAASTAAPSWRPADRLPEDLPAPWLVVDLYLISLAADPDAAAWLGDAERCIAWAWIETRPEDE